MAKWLFKEEPDCYSFDQLEKDGETVWEGVRNALALKHLRAVQPGDEVYFYHTGDVKAVVGVMTAAGGPVPTGEDGKGVALKVAFARRLPHPVPLAAIKADLVFAEWELVRISRLSVMPVPAAVAKRIEQLAKNPPSEPTAKAKVKKKTADG